MAVVAILSTSVFSGSPFVPLVRDQVRDLKGQTEKWLYYSFVAGVSEFRMSLMKRCSKAAAESCLKMWLL
jgi:hypothetical protein